MFAQKIFYYVRKMRYCIIFFLLILSVTTKGYGQSEARSDQIDTFKINTFAIDLDLLFYLTNKEMNKYSDLKFVNMAKTHYVLNYTELGFYFRQILDRLDDGDIYYNHYINLYAGVNKYKPASEKNAFLRFLRPEPMFVFQNNSGRGLSKRFQAGLFIFPVRYFRPNFKINFGLGLLHDWSSWEVNNSEKIEESAPEIKEKILFINDHTKLRKDLYMDFNEWRPSLILNLNYHINDALKLSLYSSYQQSVVSPFNKTIKTAYPELGKVYPYSYTNMSVVAKVYKGLALKASFLFDYENNNLSIYDSSWEYCLIIGVTWNFSGKKSFPLFYPKKQAKM